MDHPSATSVKDLITTCVIALAMTSIRWGHVAEVENLLMRRFQPCDLTSAYKAQFRARGRQRNEDIHTYVDVLQKLAEMAWPFLDPLAREELVADQFLTGLDNHELRVQVATSGV